MPESDKISTNSTRAWSSEQNVVDPETEMGLMEKEADEDKDIMDEVSFYRQLKLSKTDAENLTKAAFGGDVFKRPDDHDPRLIRQKEYQESEKLSSQLRAIWWKMEKERVGTQLQLDKIIQEKSAQNRSKELINSLEERIDIFDHIQSVIIAKKTPNEIISEIDSVIKEYNNSENEAVANENNDDARQLELLTRKDVGLNILQNFKNKISKFIKNIKKENFMTSQESSNINDPENDPEKEIKKSENEINESGKSETEKLPQESPEQIGESVQAEIEETQQAVDAEIDNNQTVIGQKSETIEDPAAKTEILSDTQKAGEGLEKEADLAANMAKKKAKKVIITQAKDKETPEPKIEARNFDQELNDLREKIKQAERSSNDQEAMRLEQEIYKLEEEQKKSEDLAEENKREKQRAAKEKNKEREKQRRIAKIGQIEANLRLGIREAEKSGNEAEVLRLEKVLRGVEQEKAQVLGKTEKRPAKDSKDKLSEEKKEVSKNPTKLENDIEETKEEKAKEESKEAKEKTPEEILREKNTEAYGGAEKLNQIFEDYKRLNELEDQGAYFDKHPLFSEWDALRVKIANINLEIIGKNRTVDLYKIQNKDGVIREYFNTKLEESFDAFKRDVEKESETSWAIRAATLIKYRNELKNCEWQGKDYYRDVSKDKYINIIKELEQKIDILNGLLGKKEGISSEEALKDLEIDDFKKIEKEPEYKGGLPAVIEAKPEIELSAEQKTRIETTLKDFGMTPEDAEKAEGFADLSFGQKLLALENLKQFTLREVQQKALSEYDEKTAEAGQQYVESKERIAKAGYGAKMTKMKGWLAKAGYGAKMIRLGITKNYKITRSKTSIQRNLTKEEYGRILQDAVKGIKNEVVERNGKLEIQYLNNLEDLNEPEKNQVQRFNEVATELSRLPQSLEQLPMGLIKDKHTRAQKRRYEELRAEYEQILKDETIEGKINPGILSLLERQARRDLKKDGKDVTDSEALIQTFTKAGEIENLMRLNRFFVENPDVQKELEYIKSGKVWKSVFKDRLVESGGFMLGGWGARWLGVKALTALVAASSISIGPGIIIWASAAGVAGGIGGWRGWRRAEESLREMDARSRGEDFEEKKERRKIKQNQWASKANEGEVAGKTVTSKKGETIEVSAGKTKKVWELELNQKERIEKNIVDADNLTKRFEIMIGRIDSLGDEIDKSFAQEGKKGPQTEKLISERLKMAQRLEIRLGYARRKLDEGLVNFGKTEEQVFNQMNLVDKLNSAVNYAELHNPTASSKRKEPSPIEERLEKFMDFKSREIDAARRWHKLKQMGRGAAYGVGFASAGVAARWLMEHVGGGGSVPPEAGIAGKSGAAGYESGKGPDMFPWEKHFGQGGKGEVPPPGSSGGFSKESPPLGPMEGTLSGAEGTHPLPGAEGTHPLSGAEGTHPLPGTEATIPGGSSKAAEFAAGTKSFGAKPETAQFIDEIKNIGGIKHDSIWRSTHELVRQHAKEMDLEYPGKGGTKLTETEWYNLKTSQLVNELDKQTPGGIKDLVHEADKVIAVKGADGKFHIGLEESSGIKAGHLSDLHHAAAKGDVSQHIKTETAQEMPVSAPDTPVEPQPSRVAPEPWDSRLKQEFKVMRPEGQAEAATQQAIDKRLNDIFKYLFGRQGAETMTYQNIKNDSAENFLHHDFFKEAAGNHSLDVSEKDALMHDILKYENLQKHLDHLIRETGNRPRAGETVDQFIRRVNHNIATAPEHAVPETVSDKVAPSTKPSQEWEIDKDFFKEHKTSVAETILKESEKIVAAQPVHVSHGDFSADIKFAYNQNGEPIGVEWINTRMSGVHGTEYYKSDYLKSINEWVKQTHTDEALHRRSAGVNGRNLIGHIKAYEELNYQGENQKAGLLLEYIKKQISELNHKFGKEIIDGEKLPEILRK